MKVNGVIFTPRVSFSAQGTLKFVLKRWRPEGFFVRELGKGNGNWTVYRPGKVEVEIDDNGEVICLDVTHQVKELYGRKRLTEKFAKDIEVDLRTGKLSLDDL